MPEVRNISLLSYPLSGVSTQTQTNGEEDPLKPEVAMEVKVMDGDMIGWVKTQTKNRWEIMHLGHGGREKTWLGFSFMSPFTPHRPRLIGGGPP